jgi:hypothetical protein
MRKQQLTGSSGILLSQMAPKKIPRTDSRVKSGLSEEIEGKLSLPEKEVPKVRWKG